jgi:hypothetical protein
MLEPALGHIHNDGVRSMLIEAAERLPAGGRGVTDEAATDVVIAVIGDFAVKNGLSRSEAESKAVGQLIYTLERHPEVPRANRIRSHLLQRDGAIEAVARERALWATMSAELAWRKERRDSSASVQAASSRATSLDDAVYDLIDMGSLDTELAPVVIAKTDTISDAYAGYFNSQTQDTLYRIEDITDSSRVLWETAALAAWIEDTTVFLPRLQGDGCGRRGCYRTSNPTTNSLSAHFSASSPASPLGLTSIVNTSTGDDSGRRVIATRPTSRD